jgi:predicted permease
MTQDIRYALRYLAKHRAFTLIVVLTVSVGVGVNATTLSLARRVFLEPFHFANPERLVVVWGTGSVGGTSFGTFSDAELQSFREQSRTLASIAGFEPIDLHLPAADGPLHVAGGRATVNVLETLGVRPLLGRTFVAADAAAGAAPVAILSHRLWQSGFGGDSSVVGRSLALVAAPAFGGAVVSHPAAEYEVVGVLPPGIRLPVNDADLWIPLPMGVPAAQANSLRLIARLNEGIEPPGAAAELSTIEDALRQVHPQITTRGVRLVSFAEQSVGDLQRTLTLLGMSSAIVLTIACGTIAGLLLARASQRRREVAIRSALGATGVRLTAQLLTEAGVIAGVACAGSLLFAHWAIPVLAILTGADAVEDARAGLDGVALTSALVMSLGVAIVFGLVPAMLARRVSFASLHGSGVETGSRLQHHLWNALVTGQVALALMLLTGAALLGQSLLRLNRVDAGFNPEGLLTARLGLPPARYPTGASREAFYRALLERLTQLPGVQAASVTNVLPFVPGETGIFFTVDGRPAPDPWEVPTVNTRFVSPGYFQTIGIPVIGGRSFREGDARPLKVIVSEAMAREHWPGEDAVGKRLRLNRPENASPPLEIVGVVGDVRQSGPADPVRPVLYLPLLQQATMMLVVRTTADPALMTPQVRDLVTSIDPRQPLHDVQTMDQRRAESVIDSRRRAFFATSLAGIAALLAVLGVYGVVSFVVAGRTREFGLRLALGADRRAIGRLVLRQGMVVTAVGIAIGLAGALVARQAIAGMLFGVAPIDPPTFAAVSGMLAAAALLACYLPLRRAVQVDPVAALRTD